MKALQAELLAAYQRHQACEKAISEVADILRRDQKFAPPGRPSLHLVQLRKQQATVKQAALVARQELARTAQAWVQAAGLPVPPKRTPTEVALAWLKSTADSTTPL